MYSIHPNCLFHFTNSRGLRGILHKQAFLPSYARERLSGKTYKKSYGVAVVSFCDLRLSEVRHHMLSYGNFGIGLSKSWGKASALSPVVYLSDEGKFVEPYLQALHDLHILINTQNPSFSTIELDSLTKSYHNVMKTLEYAKNYEGIPNRSSKISGKIIRFADENEWRFVPDFLSSALPAVISDTHINTPPKKARQNSKIERFQLPYSAGDVKYLLVPNDRSIPRLFHTLEKSNMNSTEIELLKSRVLTTQQIKEDL